MIASIKIISDNRVDIRYEDILCKAYSHDFFVKVIADSLPDLIDKIILTLAKIDVRTPYVQKNNSSETISDADSLKLQIFEAMHQLATLSKIDFDGNKDIKLVIKKEFN